MKHIKKYESFSVNEELKLSNFADLATAFRNLVSMSAEDIIKKFPVIADVESKVNAVLSNQKLDATDLKNSTANTQLSSVAGDLSESKINENIFTNIKGKLKSIWDKVKAPAALVSAAAALAPIFMEVEGFVARGQADTFKFLGFNDHDPGGQSVTGLGFAAMVYAVAALAYYVKKGLVDKQVAAAAETAAETTANRKPAVKRDKYGRPI